MCIMKCTKLTLRRRIHIFQSNNYKKNLVYFYYNILFFLSKIYVPQLLKVHSTVQKS